MKSSLLQLLRFNSQTIPSGARRRFSTQLIVASLALCGAFFASSAKAAGQSKRAETVGISSRSQPLSIDVLQKHLSQNKLGWWAGRTSVSDLHPSERRLMTGASLSDVRVDGDYGKKTKVLEDALPERLDWRAMNGKDYVTPVKNQGRCGSCVAFSSASTFETQMNIATDSLAHAWTFSPQHLFSCGGAACDFGWFVASAMDFMVGQGLPEEACFPYKSGAMGEDMECKQSCSDSKVRSTKATLRVRSRMIVGASIDDVKKALLGGPVVTTMRVYDDFMLYKGGVYRHAKGGIVGGHAVMIIGWDNADEAWIVRNSWGTDWGEQGDFRISWSDPSGVGGTFYGIQPSKEFSTVILEGLRDGQSIRQPASLTVRGQNVSFSSATLELQSSGRPLISRPFDSTGALTLNPAELADGIYTVQARVQNEKGEQRISQAHLVYVRNSPASATIKIERIKLNQNVWEKIVPEFAVTSRPIPLKAVQYRVLDPQGKEVRVRRTDHTADRVAMSFNPSGLSVGHYTMLAEAISDDDQVLASDRTEFNIIEK
ncbi:hypothetical protein EBU99_04740 [bacterium]|nr:hypothetical protein [bacterium]